MTEIENYEYYLEQLNDQISFLVDACNNYDKGNFRQAKMMSSIIRTIVKDPERKSRTISLLTHLHRKNSTNFYNTGFEAEQPIININLVGIVNIPSKSVLTKGKTDNIYLPLFDKSQQIDVKWLDFKQWWESKIIVYKSQNNNIEFTRKSIVLTMAEQDGGTHVDSVSDVELNYLELATATKGLFNQVNSAGNESPIINIHFALVRQIAHELLISLIKEFKLDIEYKPTNEHNLNGASESEIKQFGVFAEVGFGDSSRTKTPHKKMATTSFKPPANINFMRFSF